MPRFILVIAVAVALLATIPTSSAKQTAYYTPECATWQDHRAEACAAYVVLDAHGALQAYYKYVKSDSVLAGLKNLFPKRYKGTAPATIRAMARISKWPSGTNKVEGPRIDVVSADSSLSCNRGVLHTRESWVVRSPANSMPLYSVYNHRFTIVLRRVPGEIVVINGQSAHAWDVYQIYNGWHMLPTC